MLLYHFFKIKPRRVSLKIKHFLLQILKPHYYDNVWLSYLSINPLRNILNDLRTLVTNTVNIMCVSETKLSANLPKLQFSLPDSKKLNHGYVTSSSVDIFIFVKSNLPNKEITTQKLSEEIRFNFLVHIISILSIYKPLIEDMTLLL